MSTKHLFPSVDGLVVKYLHGLIASNPSLSLIPSDKVVFNTKTDRSKVAIISGGGAGHEPAWCGYVGRNMLAAAASGDIFASPSARQIESAIMCVPSDEGTILVITNYTGDCLHFGMACEKANAAGYQKGPVHVLCCGDDVSVGNRANDLVGRRGLPGQILVCKVLGAAAESGMSFEKVLLLGNALKDQLVSIAASLDHCHVPGRAEYSPLHETTIEIGTGPHNEPGYISVSPQPSPEELVGKLVKYLTEQYDPDRAYVKFAEGDEVAILVNNFGGMSFLETGALTDEFLGQLPSHINPVRVYTGMFETSLNAPAFALTICNLTAAVKGSGLEISQLLTLLDSKTDSAWEAVAGNQTVRRPRKSQIVKSPVLDLRPSYPAQLLHHELKVNPEALEAALHTACDLVIAAEPDLTKWDTIMGDGDCGETFRTGCQELLSLLSSGLASSGSLLTVLATVAEIAESKMGGTLGAILSIFFHAFHSELAKSGDITSAPVRACRILEGHTAARVGHRTILDVIIPATEKFRETGRLEAALEAAVKSAEGTKRMKPLLGRATYVGGMEGKELPADPGAWGAMLLIKGLYDGLQS